MVSSQVIRGAKCICGVELYEILRLTTKKRSSRIFEDEKKFSFASKKFCFYLAPGADTPSYATVYKSD